MRRKTYRIMAIMATALLAFATGGCVDPLDDSLKPQPEQPTLTFWIHVPGSVLATKANPGDVASISPESMIYDVQVWVFDHNKTDGATKPLNYVYKDIAGGFQYSPNITIDDTPEVVANKIWEAAYKIQMPLPKEFVLGTDPCVDFYILANWQSIFNNKPAGDLTLTEVRDMVFGAGTKANAYFGTSAPTTAVPSVDVGEGDNQETQVLGLPISTVYKGANGDGVSLEFLKRAYLGLEDEDDNKVNVIDNDLFKRKLGVIELERAVSKVRFVFAKPEGMNNVEITKIVINSGVIPTSTYTFPNSHSEFYPGGDSQVFEDAAELVGATANVPLLASGDIIGVTDPEILSSNCERVPTGYQVSPKSMEAQEYDDYLTNATSGVKPSTAKLIYFRETDNAIEGTIHYKIDGVAKEPKPFKMTIVSNDVYNNFHRNHYWTVYAYFRGGGLYIKPVVLPWEDATASSYTWSGEAHVAVSDVRQGLFAYGWTTANDNEWYQPDTGQKTEWFFRRQEINEQGVYDWDDWVYRSQVVIAPGLNAAGTPIYSNRIQLLSSFESREGFTGLTLKSDNAAFGFVVYNSTIIVDGEEQTINGLSGIMDEVVIPIGSRTTYFYVTPKAVYNYTVPYSGEVPDLPDNCKVAISLVTNESSPVKVPFNTSVFPGSQDNGDIYLYCVTEAEFKDYYFSSSRPDGIKPYGKDSDGYINPVNID